MSLAARLALAAAILVVDVVTVGVPLGAIFLAWVIAARPPVVLGWVLAVYGRDER